MCDCCVHLFYDIINTVFFFSKIIAQRSARCWPRSSIYNQRVGPLYLRSCTIGSSENACLPKVLALIKDNAKNMENHDDLHKSSILMILFTLCMGLSSILRKIYDGNQLIKMRFGANRLAGNYEGVNISGYRTALP